MSRSYENLAASKLPPHKKYSYSHSDLSTLNNSNYDYDFPSSSRPSSHRVSRFAEFRYKSGGLSQESSKLPFYGTASEERGYRKKRSKSKARSPYMVQNNRLSASDNSDEEEFYRRRLPEKRYEFDGQLSSSSTEKKKPGSIRSSKKPIKSSLKKPSYSSATPRTSDDSDVSNSDYPTDNPRHSSHVVIAPLSFDESQKLYEMQQLRITEMFEGREERVRESLKRQEKWLIFREWIAGVLDLIFGVGDNKEFLRGEQIVGSGLPNPVFLIYRIIATIYTFIVLVSLISQEPSTNFVLDFGLWSWIILFVYFVSITVQTIANYFTGIAPKSRTFLFYLQIQLYTILSTYFLLLITPSYYIISNSKRANPDSMLPPYRTAESQFEKFCSGSLAGGGLVLMFLEYLFARLPIIPGFWWTNVLYGLVYLLSCLIADSANRIGDTSTLWFFLYFSSSTYVYVYVIAFVIIIFAFYVVYFLHSVRDRIRTVLQEDD